ncbi:MAG: RCC1 domain-containing protein [Actinomycetota bacterium]
MFRYIRNLALLATFLVVTITAPMSARADVPLSSLTLLGPPTAAVGDHVTYYGSLTEASEPVPLQTIQIRIDGQPAASAQTDDNGSFGATVTYPTAGQHVIQAFFLSRVPVVETASDSIHVLVSPLHEMIAAGGEDTCAVLPDGTARCWGSNGAAQVGDGQWIGNTQAVSTPQVVLDGATGEPLSHIVTVAVGPDHSCALISDGTMKCWGWNSQGQLGLGFVSSVGCGCYAAALQVKDPTGNGFLTGVTAIAANNGITCAVTNKHQVLCWGGNFSGQLGNGTTTDSALPVAVSNLSNAVGISVDDQSPCALLLDGTAKCWGSNWAGKLGNGEPGDYSSTTPVAVKGLTDAIAIAADWSHTCALINDGTIRCWGFGQEGQLGNGSSDSSVPLEMNDISNAVAVAPGAGHTCALTFAGTVRCVGWNYYGQLGNGTTNGVANTTLSDVIGVSSIIGIAGGYFHACAIVTDGSGRCWGGNTMGQLGNGTTTDSDVPVVVSNFP